MENDTLKNKTIDSMIWSFVDNIGSQVIQLIIQLFLARLLTPRDFGIIGMVTIFIALSQVFIDSGFTNGIIREKNVSQDDYSTIFFFNLFMAVILYILLFASAGYISAFFEVPQLVLIVKVLGLVLIINAFGLIQKTILTKKIDFAIQMKVNLISSVVSGIIAIGFALAGFGVWSLVIRNLIMQLLQAILFSLANQWKPALVFSKSSFKRLFSFGWKLLVASLLSKIYENIYALIIGRGFSTVSLGFYTNARKLSETFSFSVASSVEKVSYPVLSNIQDDPERLKSGFKKIVKNSVFLTFPAMLGLVTVAAPAFRLLLGENWIPAIPYFQIISLSGMLTSLNSINLNILQVKGRSDLFLKLSIYRKITGFMMIGFVLFFNLGIMELLWALVI
ncbi:lipopolysaccharide biosynthesis protein, partial [Alkalibacterium sp. 20]|uniref:lipopolysaccharide biosynthesis protein n=1 Tax=Alkalibacterium sp. 20 TaxID=1798803 RepID=UPI0009004D68